MFTICIPTHPHLSSPLCSITLPHWWSGGMETLFWSGSQNYPQWLTRWFLNVLGNTFGLDIMIWSLLPKLGWLGKCFQMWYFRWNNNVTLVLWHFVDELEAMFLVQMVVDALGICLGLGRGQNIVLQTLGNTWVCIWHLKNNEWGISTTFIKSTTLGYAT
jgi:hypothetical protein